MLLLAAVGSAAAAAGGSFGRAAGPPGAPWGGEITVRSAAGNRADRRPLAVTVYASGAQLSWEWDADRLGRQCAPASRAVPWAAGAGAGELRVTELNATHAAGVWRAPAPGEEGRWHAAAGRPAGAARPCAPAADSAAARGGDTCVVPPTQLLTPDSTCASLGAAAAASADLAGMPGERENFQVLIVTPEGTPAANLSASVSGLPSGWRVQVRQVGFVNCKQTTRYAGSGGGWKSDPLLPLEGGAVLALGGTATPLWFSVDIPSGASAGKCTGTVTVGGSSFPLAVAVWPTALPPAAKVHAKFGEIWSFETGDLKTLYGAAHTNQTDYDFFSLMTDALLPPDNLYKSAPYSDFGRYEYLARTGAVLLNLADIGACNTMNASQVNATLERVAPTVDRLLAEGLVSGNVPYVYGYDERPRTCEGDIRQLFGAFKQRWPKLYTAAVLNWAGGLPADLPVDIWILQYEDYKADEAKAWRAAGKKQYWYHCIEPSGAAYLNTFIERPRTQGRLLYWLAAANAVDGWLYYATDIWRPHPGEKHHPLQRINGSALTDFDPSNYIWAPRTDIFANGDGQFVYPGVDAAGRPQPLSSSRLELMRDAVEDQVLLSAALAKSPDAAAKLIAKLVRSPTDHTDDPALLEATRRELAALL